MNYDIQKLKQAFTGNPDLFINHYFPNAKRKAGNYHIGDTSGQDGDSLVIGSRTYPGKYRDFAGEERGDLIDLLKANRGLGLKDALKEIADLYSIQPEMDLSKGRKKIVPLKPITKVTAVTYSDPVEVYLTQERGINEKTIKDYRLEISLKDAVVFPHINEKGEVIQRHYVSLQRDERGKKRCGQDKGAYHYCFGMHLVDQNTRSLVITEGQIDCMTAYQCGVKNVLSVPMGCGKFDFIDTHWDLFTQCDDIILCFDMDEQGRTFSKEVAKRLGLDRCRVVELPEHDLNDCWNNGCDESDIQEIINSAKHIENELIYEMGSSSKATLDYIKMKEANPGDDFCLDGLDFRQRMGELTIWTGYSGSGKTTILNQNILNLLHKNAKYKVFYASFEQNTHDLEILFLKQMKGCMYNQDIDAYLAFIHGRVYDYIPSKNRSIPELFKTMNYALKRYGCNLFIIDNLVTSGINEDDSEEVKKFANGLKDFSKDNEVSTHLVAHSRKSSQDDNETKVPSKASVSGTKAITDVCDNGITIWRNPGFEFTEMNHDGVIRVWKNRDNGDLGSIDYYFNKAFKKATTNPDYTINPIQL